MNIRKLKADEIECRVKTVKENGISLLLYKTARVDRAILDETFGLMNWQNDFKVIDGKMYGGIGIKSENEWVWKWDCGTESNTEKEKGEASDCFKRAGFKWGIGTELYTTPFIWIAGNGNDLKYKKFEVSEIGYAENGDINKLVIIDDKGNNVFTLGIKKKPEKPIKGTITTEDAEIYIKMSKINDIETLKSYYEVNKSYVNNQKEFHEMVCQRLKVLKEAAQQFDEAIA